MKNDSVIVIGGGIAGLTAASLLANEGIPVILLEAHFQTGGCAGTFKRGQYIFDVGATQVAGLEKGGIHERIFKHLQIPPPTAKILDPACLVDLCDGSEPIKIWHDQKKWQEERTKQFPNSELFWKLCSEIHKSNWEFNNRHPILPIRNFWDFNQLIKAFRVNTLFSALLSPLTIRDLLLLCNCNKDLRLRKFLDLQLKLYSQEDSSRTPALYGATILQISQVPHGLFHLQKSMQELSNTLSENFLNNKGKLLLNHKVINLKKNRDNDQWEVTVKNQKQDIIKLTTYDVLCSLTPQSLLELIEENSEKFQGYKKILQKLNKPTGAIVFYGAISRKSLSSTLPSHVQLTTKPFGSLFISISQEGDGRAPIGKATITASVFTETSNWIPLNRESYQNKKQNTLNAIQTILENWLKLNSNEWLHKELATPKSFAFWTGRPNGIVGGLGQNPFNFGLLGMASRTSMKGLWLCGDSIHPGEGTAGVSQSALMAVRQIMSNRGKGLKID